MESWKIEKDLCRCCHREGSFRALSELCSIGGEEGYYSDMLRLTLNIHLKPVEGVLQSHTYTICDECILRVRDATAFKQQVKRCEGRFQEMYNKGIIKLEVPIIKVEVPDLEDDKMDTGDQNYGNDTFDTNDTIDSDPPVKIDVEICKMEPDPIDTKRRSTRTKKAVVKPQEKAKPKPKPRKVKVKPEKSGEDDEGAKKGTLPAFRLTAEDYWQDGETYHCGRCEKTYDKFFSLRFHVKTKHYKIPRYPCPYCVAKFMTPAPLTVHKLQEHNIDERFKCNACKGAFNTKIQLRKHINNFHMLGEKHKCEFCDYESFSFEGLYKHKFKHKTVKDYHCRFCRKAFLRKTTLDLHERIHTGDRRKVCKVCSQAFVQKASLNYHMTKYHPEVNF